MKPKLIIIIVAVLAVVAGGFFFIRKSYAAKPQKAQIEDFLAQFNHQLSTGQVDSLVAFFDTRQKPENLLKFLNILSHRTGLDNKTNSQLLFNLDVAGSDIMIHGSRSAEVGIPITFQSSAADSKTATLTLKLYRDDDGRYRITQVDARDFLTVYARLKNQEKAKNTDEKTLFGEETLEAFKKADQLKSKYDSVVWFAHQEMGTYFYVVKGKWDMQNIYFWGEDGPRRDADKLPRDKYGMGLVGPDLKEIIPPQYDLVHNIDGTFEGMVEVESAHKKGFYNISGKLLIPVEYDQILPVDDDQNLALLRKGDDYFYFKKDSTISEKTDVKLTEILPKVQLFKGELSFNGQTLPHITEFNSRDVDGSVYVAPSYLVDLNFMPMITKFGNPLRKRDYMEDISKLYQIKLSGKSENDNNWLDALYYSARNYYVGGRSEFYDTKKVVLVDKKNNRFMATDLQDNYEQEDMGSGSYTGICNGNSLKAMNDSVYEIKTGASFYRSLYNDDDVDAGPSYHYMVISNGKLKELPNNRIFGFTKYVKMNDSYVNACYELRKAKTPEGEKAKAIDHMTPEMLRYMLNEIYADYQYKFKDPKWDTIFYFDTGDEIKGKNASVDDSLTAIDKYNIDWISKKLKVAKTTKLAAN